jgi:hypothetical protein
MGPDLTHELLAAGIVLGTGDGKVLFKRLFGTRARQEDFDKKTWDEFWCKFPDALAQIEAAATARPIKDVYDCLMGVEEKYGPLGRRHEKKVVFKFISDNPGYDLGKLAVAFRDAGYKRLPQEIFDDYVSCQDPTEQMRTMSPQTKQRVLARVKTQKDHNPVNDALRNYELLLAIKEECGR